MRGKGHHRQLSTHAPGSRSFGMRTSSVMSPTTQSLEHAPMPLPSQPSPLGQSSMPVSKGQGAGNARQPAPPARPVPDGQPGVCGCRPSRPSWIRGICARGQKPTLRDPETTLRDSDHNREIGCRASRELTGSRAHMDPLGQVPSVTKTGFGTGNRSVPFLGIGGTFEAPSALTGTSLVSVTSVSLEETFVQESCGGAYSRRGFAWSCRRPGGSAGSIPPSAPCPPCTAAAPRAQAHRSVSQGARVKKVGRGLT